MAETLEKNLDDMEKVTEGTTQSKTAVNKDAKPGEPIDTSKGGAAKVIDVNTDSEEGAKGTKNAGASAAGAVKHEGSKSLSTKPSAASAKMEDAENEEENLVKTVKNEDKQQKEKINKLQQKICNEKVYILTSAALI